MSVIITIIFIALLAFCFYKLGQFSIQQRVLGIISKNTNTHNMTQEEYELSKKILDVCEPRWRP